MRQILLSSMAATSNDNDSDDDSSTIDGHSDSEKSQKEGSKGVVKGYTNQLTRNTSHLTQTQMTQAKTKKQKVEMIAMTEVWTVLK